MPMIGNERMTGVNHNIGPGPRGLRRQRQRERAPAQWLVRTRHGQGAMCNKYGEGGGGMDAQRGLSRPVPGKRVAGAQMAGGWDPEIREIRDSRWERREGLARSTVRISLPLGIRWGGREGGRERIGDAGGGSRGERGLWAPGLPAGHCVAEYFRTSWDSVVVVPSWGGKGGKALLLESRRGRWSMSTEYRRVSWVS